MKTIKQFKTSLTFLGIWLVCLYLYWANSIVFGYSSTYVEAKKLGGFMHECSGAVIQYGELGFRCDGYGPSKIANIIILIGIISFIVTVVTFTVRITSKTNK